jgi:hypothetical protein
MAVTPAVLISAKYAENSQTTQYTVTTGQKVIIDKLTVTNIHASSAAALSVNLVASGDSAGANNLLLDAKSLAAGESYTCPEIVGHVLASGDFISTLCDTATALTIRASGRVIT